MIKKCHVQLDFNKRVVPCRKLHQNHDWKTVWTLSGTYGGDHAIGYAVARLRCRKCGKSKMEKSTH